MVVLVSAGSKSLSHSLDSLKQMSIGGALWLIYVVQHLPTLPYVHALFRRPIRGHSITRGSRIPTFLGDDLRLIRVALIGWHHDLYSVLVEDIENISMERSFERKH